MGLLINYENDEIVIKGNKIDLEELSDYIKKIALSNYNINHIHLDNLTIVNDNSNIKNLIIEKDDIK